MPSDEHSARTATDGHGRHGGPAPDGNAFERIRAAAQSRVGEGRPGELSDDDVRALAEATGDAPAMLRRFAEAHRMAAEADVAPEIVFALLQTGLPADPAALAAAGDDPLRRAVDAAIAEGAVAPDIADRAAAGLEKLGRRAIEQPVFLARPHKLYATTEEAAAGDDDAATLLNTRLDAALHDELEARLGQVSPALDRAVHEWLGAVHWRDSLDLPLKELLDDALASAARETDLATEAQEARDRLAAMPAQLVGDVLHTGEPLESNPVLADDLDRGKAVEFARLAGLTDGETRAVVERAPAIAEGNVAVIEPMVGAGALDSERADALREVLELGKLTGHNLELMRALGERGTTAPIELTRLDREAWARLIDENEVPLPPGQTSETYADAIVRNLDEAFPTQTLLARLGNGAVGTFLDHNRDVDLRLADLVDADGDHGVDWSGIGQDDRPQVQQQLRAAQRVMAIADDVDVRAKLIDRGFDSAIAISAEPEYEFVANSGLDRAAAKAVYARSQEAATNVALTWSALHDITHGLFADLQVGNFYAPLVNDLRRIDGFAELFGSQDFCDCDKCHSVLSPAAYFVDLMHFIEQHVSKPVFITPGKTQHPLYLKRRRPDLWTLPLTCDNTNTLIPYLTIVNEVLESFLDQVVGGDIWQTLASPADKVSFRVPFILPWAELVLYLSHFGIGPADVYATLRRPDADVRRARLAISPDEAAVIATADPAGAVQRLGSPPSLVDFPVQELLRASGLARDQLDDVLELRSNPDIGSVKVAKQKVPDELQNFPEILKDLTDARVDFIHRFVRLWRATPWSSIPELDLLILSLADAGVAGPQVDQDLIEQLGRLAALGATLRLGVEDLCALAGPLPVSKDYPLQPAADAERRLYERLFDLKKLFGVKDPATGELEQSVAFHHYSLNRLDPTDTKIDPKTPLVLAGLGISETELLRLLDLLKDELPFDDAGDCTLDRARLSLLYRHVRVARALKLQVDDLIRALEVLFAPGDRPLESLDQIEALVAFRRWLRSSPFTTAELSFVLSGSAGGPMQYANTLDTVAAIVLAIQQAAPADPVAALRTRLAGLFNVTGARLDNTLEWVAADPAAPAIATALAAPFTDEQPDNPNDLQPILELVQQIERVAALFANLKLDDTAIDYLTRHQAALGIADLKALTLDDVKALLLYRALAVLRDGAEADVQAALDAYLAAGTVTAGAERERLAALWSVDVSLINSLVDVLPLPAEPIEALGRLAEGLAMCQTLGVNAYSLKNLGDDSDFAALATARDVALGAFSAKYEEERVRDAKLEPYVDRVNVAKRDALCDYIIARQPELKFRDRNEIYNYFLLDVEMSGCFRTSRVVAAISSAQLYVQRCLLNLEQSDPALNPAIADIAVDPARIPAEEWEWRKNYRVWEANRKVFLFPESYMDPDLRDDKTPVFSDLEDNLLQRKIDEASAADAYQRYITQFSELAHLRVCGTLYDPASGTYYFFARSQSDPPAFYFRRWEKQTTWTPWQHIELAIDAPYVAAEIHLGRIYLFWAESKVKEKSSISGGSSSFGWYEVKVNLTYSVLDPDGKWRPPQKIDWLYPSPSETISATEKIFQDDDLAEMQVSKTFRKIYPQHVGPALILRYYNAQLNGNYYFDRRLDLFRNKLRGATGANPDVKARTAVLLFGSSNDTAQLGLEKNDFGTELYFDRVLESPANVATPHSYITDPFPKKAWTTTDPGREDDMHYVHNAYPESVFTFGDQQYLIHERGITLRDYLLSDVSAVATTLQTRSDGSIKDRIYSRYTPAIAGMLVNRTRRSRRELVRLSTSVADDLGEKLMSEGLEALFSLDTQRLREHPLGITITDVGELAPPADDPNHLPFSGAFGTYYRECFRDVPWIVGFHLNANGKFEEAKWWYERIFDPTAKESPQDKKPADRNWRYIEFRDFTVPKLKAMLTDSAAIDAYKTDPFNPWAIARLRPSAFQKAIVMHYVENLLDWGDSLFAQDTMESINEATMLYVLAAEILGRRPVKLGTCDTAPDRDLTYEKLGPAVDKGSEFLLTLENWTFQAGWQAGALADRASAAINAESKPVAAAKMFEEARIAAGSRPLSAARVQAGHVASQDRVAVAVADARPDPPLRALARKASSATLRPFAEVVADRRWITEVPERHTAPDPPVVRTPGIHLAKHSTLVFCVPQNEELLAYWDRVEDRLLKIRNCMNISGVRRSLALFAPPINPMALVRARAAGLSLEEALAGLAGGVPAHRFTHMLERARQAAQMAQSFGAALLTALEKKDVESLTLLRSTHEQEIQRMTHDVKTSQVKDTQHALQAIVENQANVQQKIDYYNGLIEEGLTGWEITQQVTRHVASGIRIVESGLHLTSAIVYLIPQVGSPFAMKYGGKEGGDSAGAWAQWTASMAGVLEAVSASAGLEATFQRRAQEWGHMLAQAQQELAQLEQQRLASTDRVAIAERELEVFEKQTEHMQEVYDFQREKFTNLGLYNYLSSTLTRLHREAYNVAHDLAVQAERAYRFETDDDDAFVAPDNWRFDRAGLLSGEQLSLQLTQLESAYLRNDKRRHEMTQSFSLALSDPAALVELRDTGSCEFTLPEVLFDVAYPGQYKRVIKSVKVTIPCVAGPYTNVSATLSLTQSRVRAKPSTDPADLVLVPPTTPTQSIATSNAQNDGGVFELTFRDERYLPFEGAGAVSTWRLDLPSQMRMFDYDTISDVVMHVSYTALRDGALADDVESQIVDALTEQASTQGLQRLFSLRHDFPDAFHLMMHPADGGAQKAEFDLRREHFPYFLSHTDVTVKGGTLFMQPRNGEPVDTTGLTLKVNNTAGGPWSNPPAAGPGTLRSSEVALSGPAFKHWKVEATGAALDPDEVEDVLLLVDYSVA